MRWLTGLLVGALTCVDLCGAQVIQNTGEDSLPFSGDVISGFVLPTGDSSDTIAILTGDEDEPNPNDWIDPSSTQGGNDTFDLLELTRNYQRFNERNTMGDDGGSLTADDLRPSGERYGEFIPEQSVLADGPAEPVAEASRLAEWLGGIPVVVLIIVTSIAIWQRKSLAT